MNLPMKDLARTTNVKLSNGVDMIEIDRVQAAIEQHGARFLERVFTSLELSETRQKPASLAARFAAKEAVAKALGCGIGDVGWREIEVRRDASQRPQLYLHGAAAELAEQLGLTDWAISLSHTNSLAIAFVVASGDQ